MGSAGADMIRLLQQQAGDQGYDQCSTEQIEGVAEGEDKGLLLHTIAT